LLSVASVTPRKGHLVLIGALARLTELDWRLRCIGSLTRDPAAVTALRQAIAQHALADRVTLAGERPPSELAAEYQAADCFVLPSFHEGYGMAFAEALSHGLPVVAARAGAVPRTVPESAGLLVPPGDVAVLAAALQRVMPSPICAAASPPARWPPARFCRIGPSPCAAGPPPSTGLSRDRALSRPRPGGARRAVQSAPGGARSSGLFRTLGGEES
jgi:hypothetical protein